MPTRPVGVGVVLAHNKWRLKTLNMNTKIKPAIIILADIIYSTIITCISKATYHDIKSSRKSHQDLLKRPASFRHFWKKNTTIKDIINPISDIEL